MEVERQTSNIPAKLSKNEKRAARKKQQRLRKKKRKLEALSTIKSRSGAEDPTGMDCSTGSFKDDLDDGVLRRTAVSVQSTSISHCSTTCDSSLSTHNKERGKKQRLREPEAAESVPVRRKCSSDVSNDRRGKRRAGSNREPLGEDARLFEALKSAREKQRDLCGKGKPLFGWDISTLAEFAFSQLAGLSEEKRADGQSKEFYEEAVAESVGAVTTRADVEHAGQVGCPYNKSASTNVSLHFLNEMPCRLPSPARPTFPFCCY